MFFSPNKNFGLKETQFEEMICQLKENGHSKWFDTIYLTHLQNGRYIPQQQSIPQEWIEDCEADAILRFKDALAKGQFNLIENHYSLKSYFLTIYRNVCVDLKRKIDRQSKADKASWFINAATQLPDTDELYRLDEASIQLVKQAYDQLKPKCRKVLDLGLGLDWRDPHNEDPVKKASHVAAAAIMGLTGVDPRNAFTALFRNCKARLRAKFEEIYKKENKIIL